MLANTVQIAYLEYMETAAAVYAGDGAAVGKWYCPTRVKFFHLIATMRGQNGARGACGTRFAATFSITGPLGKYGTKCPKCEAKA